jgi:hypothetical protein
MEPLIDNICHRRGGHKWRDESDPSRNLYEEFFNKLKETKAVSSDFTIHIGVPSLNEERGERYNSIVKDSFINASPKIQLEQEIMAYCMDSKLEYSNIRCHDWNICAGMDIVLDDALQLCRVEIVSYCLWEMCHWP